MGDSRLSSVIPSPLPVEQHSHSPHARKSTSPKKMKYQLYSWISTSDILMTTLNLAPPAKRLP